MTNPIAAGMQCPSCRVDLHLSERHGIEIDYCPRCRGVWLDRGELDKIVDRSAGAPPIYAPQGGERQDVPYDNRRRYEDDDDAYEHRYRHRKKRGFLGDLFDFD